MRPSFSIYYTANCSLAESVILCHFILRYFSRKASYFKNVAIGYFGQWMQFAFGMKSPSFFIGVVSVFLASAQEQMFRINAFWIVTMMANEKSAFYFPIVHNIRNSMRPIRYFVYCYSSVSTIESTGFPNPTGVSFFNLAPKKRHQFWGKLDIAVSLDTLKSRFIHSHLWLSLGFSGADYIGEPESFMPNNLMEVN